MRELIENMRRCALDTSFTSYHRDLFNRTADEVEKHLSVSAKKCLVKGCTNHSNEGLFHGEMCMPCYRMITEGEYSCGNTVFHHAEHERQILKQTLQKIQEVADFGLGDV